MLWVYVKSVGRDQMRIGNTTPLSGTAGRKLAVNVWCVLQEEFSRETVILDKYRKLKQGRELDM